MNREKTIFTLKDKSKGYTASNYRPITFYQQFIETPLKYIKGCKYLGISLLRYSGTFVDQTKTEQAKLNRRTRKEFNINIGLRHTSGVTRLYLPRKEHGYKKQA